MHFGLKESVGYLLQAHHRNHPSLPIPQIYGQPPMTQNDSKIAQHSDIISQPDFNMQSITSHMGAVIAAGAYITSLPDVVMLFFITRTS